MVLNKQDVTNVDAYIENAVKDIQPFLSEIRKIILSAIPELEESIKWRMPVFTDHGKNLVNIAAYKAHVRFGVADALTDENHELFTSLGYQTGEKMVRLGYDQEIPADQLTILINEQAKKVEMKENI